MEVIEMLSFPLLRLTCKNNYKSWLIFTILLILLTLFIFTIYDPQNAVVSAMIAVFPKEILDVLGINMLADSLTGHLSSNLYGFILLIVPMIYTIATANRLMAKQVNGGMMTHLLSAPHKRRSIAFTQSYYLIMSLVLMFLFIIIFEVGCILLLFPGQLKWLPFILLNIGVLCLHICISGICFLASCICDVSKTSIMIGGGLSVLFYLIQLLADTGGKLKYLRYITIFTLFDTEKILLGDFQIYWMLPVLAVIGLNLIGLGITIFQKRDLPL